MYYCPDGEVGAKLSRTESGKLLQNAKVFTPINQQKSELGKIDTVVGNNRRNFVISRKMNW